MSRNMYIFNPEGGLPYERGGDAGNFELDPVFWPLKETIFLQCPLGIDVIENFDYMNWVNKTNWQNIYLRVQP